MKELKPRIHENGIDYILVGDYYVPDWKLPEEHRPIGKWGNLHRAYLRQFRPALYSTLVLSCKLHTYLADLNEQATERCSLIIEQMAEAEGVKDWILDPGFGFAKTIEQNYQMLRELDHFAELGKRINSR